MERVMNESERHKRSRVAALVVFALAATSGAILLLCQTNAGRQKVGPPPEQARPAVAVSRGGPSQPGPEAKPAENPRAKVFDWRTVESTDYRTYIANLRAIGCPEETIRDMILADVNKMFAERGRTKAGTNRFEYWKPGSAVSRLVNADFLKEQAQLALEKKALLKELLGTEMSDKPDLSGGLPAYEQMLDFLPPEKWGHTLETELLFAGRLASGIRDMLSGDFNSLKRSLAEKETLLGQMLTPEEKFEYDARLSYTAVSLQNRLGEFTPTEPEYRELVRLQKNYDDNYGPLSLAAAGRDVSQERAAAQKELDTQTRAVLGDERYQEYRHEQNWTRSNLRTVAEEYAIPKHTAFKVFDLTDVANEQADQIRADALLSQSQKQAALNAVRGQTQTAVAEVIGQPALEAYMKRSGTINNLGRLTK
jgi:hypothetical protein